MNLFKKISKFLIFSALAMAILAASGIIGIYFYVKPNLPAIDSLKDVQLQVPLRIYSKDAKLIAEYGEKRRIPLTFEQIPPLMVKAFLAAEDDRFYEHPGVDYQGLLRAAVQLALTGEKKQGGSTITMQVARNFFLSNKKTYLRKINEIFLAIKIDQELSKNDILTLYLNKIYLGNRAYGVGAASRVYYGKPIEELNLPQIAMIAGLPKAPSSYNPVVNPERALVRRNYVINRMKSLGYISADEAAGALAEPVTAKKYAANIELDAPYIAEMARAEIFERFGEESYTRGLSVYTTVSSDMQNRATESVHLVCNDYDMRHGYRGPVAVHDSVISETDEIVKILKSTPTVGPLIPALVTQVMDQSAEAYLADGTKTTIPWAGLSWARKFISEDQRGPQPKSASDILVPGALVYLLQETSEKPENGENYWRLAQVPDINSALVSLDSSSGAILALSGGYDYYQNKFNRATQAYRQPGSGFKAFIYSAALENGFTAASLINDAPVVFEDSSLETAWRPENYSGKFFGPTRLRYALTKSRNLVSIRLVRSMGIQNTLNHVEKFGFRQEELPHNLSIALGSANVTPLQMVRGYSVLSNGGYLIDPYLIEEIRDGSGTTIFKAQPKIVCHSCEIDQTGQASTSSAKNSIDDIQSQTTALSTADYAPRVISKENRYIMYSMMQDVITAGTATKARVLKRQDLAGKTGTTNDQRDAWFNGYNQSIATSIWVGFDNNQKLGRGEVGGKAALPGWINYMQEALKMFPEDTPPVLPQGMLTIRIDPVTGKLAAPGQKNAIFEVFRADQAPTERADTGLELPEEGSASSTSRKTGNTPAEELF